MKGKEPQTTKVTRDPAMRAEFIELLKTGLSTGEIASIMGVHKKMANESLRRLLWETTFQLANEDEITKLWSCVLALSKRLAELEERFVRYVKQ